MIKKLLPNVPRSAGFAVNPLRARSWSFAVRLLLLGLLAGPAFAQAPASQAVEMADALRADGKIWVVVGVFAIVTLGVLIYIFRLESKVTKLEERMRKQE